MSRTTELVLWLTMLAGLAVIAIGACMVSLPWGLIVAGGEVAVVTYLLARGAERGDRL